MVVALIPAAGQGIRMGLKEKKQFVKIKDKPVIFYTLEVFEAVGAIDSVVLVVPADYVDFCLDMFVNSEGFTKIKAVIEGGDVRQRSVKNGLDYLKREGILDADLVVIHDGVRPMVTLRLVERCVEAAQQSGSCVAAVPIKDTVKVVDNGVVVETLKRERLWAVQTPQVFPFGLLFAAHEHAFREGIIATDDAALVELMNSPIKVVMGDYENLKITQPCDLLFFETVLNYREGLSFCSG